MSSVSSPKRRYKAAAVVDFPRIGQFLEPILASIATHDMVVIGEDGNYRIASAFGEARLETRSGQLLLSADTEDHDALNRLKHALVGPISFIAASEKLEIEWSGDDTGLTPLEDLRVLRVKQVIQLTPHMRRIVFAGDDLGRFDRPDQLHCRLIFQPKDVASPEWPALDGRGHVVWPRQRKLDTRVYTIRTIDAEKGEITIDFASHDSPGPATRWALTATSGDMVGIVGPAADGPKPAEFYVLAGDETGLPGIARILEHLDDKAQGIAFVEIDGPDEIQLLARPPGIALRWLDREGAAPGTTTLLVDAVRSVDWPSNLDSSFFWGGCEHGAFREIHRILRKDIQLPRSRQVLYSHWHRSLSEEQIIAVGGQAYLPD
jgi:NADPH-dependent ferric siderophore reductase